MHETNEMHHSLSCVVLILIITGRYRKTLARMNPTKFAFKDRRAEMYEEHLKPIVSALDYSCAETFRGIYVYRGDSENATKNRHGHVNKFPRILL